MSCELELDGLQSLNISIDDKEKETMPNGQGWSQCIDLTVNSGE